jgi:membrane protein required for colicin V production
MEFNYFDLVVGIIVLLLGLKGIINGFFKEVFGLLGIVGGIFIASRAGNVVGQYLSDAIFKFENSAAINFTGFLVTLAIFWLFMITVGFMFKKLSSMSGLGAMDKILGFVFGAGKFFLIFAVIAHIAYNVKAVKKSVDPLMQSSFMFPILVETGGFIMRLDPAEATQKINDSIDENVKAIQEKTKDIVEKSTEDIVEETKKQIEQAKDAASETINDLNKKKEDK